MKLKLLAMRALAAFLSLSLLFGPELSRKAWGQDEAASASDEEIQTIQQLAKAGYLGSKKDYYLSDKPLTDPDITNALIAIDATLLKVDLKSLKPGDKRYQLVDLKSILAMAKDREEDIRAQKISAWIFERRLEKMIAALSQPEAQASPTEEPTPETLAAKPSPVPSPTVTPVPGPNREEWNEMRDSSRDLSKRLGEIQEKYEKRIADVEAGNKETKVGYGEAQEQLKLVQRLLDHIQNDQKKLEERLAEVSKKADEKNITDTELQRDLNLMRKDLRDNTQDVSILKQEVEKLNEPGKEAATPLDQALTSKWLVGGALLVGLSALVISLTRK